MSKVIKGKELFKMIAEGKIDENTKVTVDNYGECTLGFVFEDGRNLFKWIDEDFELIEDEIDIDSIEEIKTEAIGDLANETKTIVNKILQWAKQTDKEIKSIKEK